MFGFGSSKKNEGNAAGGFGLPGLSLGNAEKAVGQGIGRTANTLKNTGEKVEDFLFGHSGKSKKNKGLSTDIPNTGAGFGISLGNSGNGIDRGIGAAVEKTGKDVEDFLLGGQRGPKNKNSLALNSNGGIGAGFGVPSIHLGQGSNVLKTDGKENNVNIGLGLPSTSLGTSLGQAGSALEKTGKDVEDWLLGSPKSKEKKHELSLSLPKIGGQGEIIPKVNASFGLTAPSGNDKLGLGWGTNSALPNLGLGGSGILDAAKKVDDDLGKVGGKIQKTGKQVGDWLWGNPKTGKGKEGLSLGFPGINGGQGDLVPKINASIDINGPSGITNLGLPNLGGSAVLDAAIKVNDDLGKLGGKIEKTGNQVGDWLWGTSKGKKGNEELSLGLPGVSGAPLDLVPTVNVNGTSGMDHLGLNWNTTDLSLSKLNSGVINIAKNVNDNLGKIEGNIEKTGKEVGDWLWGKPKHKKDNPKLTQDLSGGGPGDLVPKVTVTSGIEKSGGKVSDSISVPGTSSIPADNENLVKTTASSNPPIDKMDISGGRTTGVKIRDGTTEGLLPLGAESSGTTHEVGVEEKNTGIGGENTTPKMFDEAFSTSAVTESPYILEDFVANSTITLEEYTTGSLGASEPPSNQTTKSEETLRKIEDILKGSEIVTTMSTLPTEKKKTEILTTIGKPEPEPEFSYTNEVSKEDSTTPKIKQKFHTSVIEEVVTKSSMPEVDTSGSATPPIITLVPNNSSSIAGEKTTKLPEAVHVEPTTLGSNTKIETSIREEVITKSTTPKVGTSPPATLSPNTQVTNNNIITEEKTPKLPATILIEPTTLRSNTIIQTSVIEENATKSTTPKASTSGPVILPPFYVVPNNNSTIGEENIPKLPPTIFDKPTGERAPFIPILPSLESSTPYFNGTTSSISHTSPISSTSNNMTPVEVGTIGVGSVLLITLITFIYKKYRQCTSGSSSGSYSPKGQHRDTSGRKRSTRSNESEEDVKPGTITTSAELDTTEAVVVDIPPEIQSIEEVKETPNTKNVVDGIQKSSSIEPPTDSVEIISETQKSIEKPPRKSKTPISSPEKFTTDKTSASHLNEASLKTVSHAIGGILRDQVPNTNTTESQSNQNETLKEPQKVVDKSSVEIAVNPQDSNKDPSINSNSQNIKTEQEIREGEPLYRSLDPEIDAGSEYFSADENNDVKVSPPESPSLLDVNVISGRELRAEDVYNTEIVTEDGRRRSIEEDITESLDSQLNEQPVPISDLTNGEDTVGTLKPSAPPEEYLTKISYDTEHDCIPVGTYSQQYVKQDAEAIVDDILKTSLLVPAAITSLQYNLDSSELKQPREIKADDILDNKNSSQVINGSQEPPQMETNSNNPSPQQHEVCEEKNSTHPCDSTQDTKTIDNKEFGTDSDTSTSNNISINLPEEIRGSSGIGNRSTLDAIENILKTGYLSNLVANSGAEMVPTIEVQDLTKGTNTTSENVAVSSQNEPEIGTAEGNMSNDYIDEGFVVEHKFEFIPPRQPRLFEDDMIVFANSDTESITTLHDSPAESLVNNTGKEELRGTTGVVGDHEEPKHQTKWYVPNEETSEDLRTDGKPGEALYIVLSEETIKQLPGETSHSTTANKFLVDESQERSQGELNRPTNISYAYIEIHDDPRNETWPEHLPKNIHSISGVGLAKPTDEGFNVLKEDEPLITSSTTRLQNENSAGSSSSTKQKAIPEFIIPNMDARLTRKRVLKRRQIKSLDSGVHHYYGEYLNLVEFPEGESGNRDEKKKDMAVIEEVLTVKPDGSITQEKIVIE